jgi:tRNA threonylcarbamoyladenosine modification (KEOPS) complex  Pcc1 subunit
MYRTEITIRYASPCFARSVRDALSPDDSSSGEVVKVVTSVRGKILHVRIVGAHRVETLQATVQDVFRCIHAAETSLGKIAEK